MLLLLAAGSSPPHTRPSAYQAERDELARRIEADQSRIEAEKQRDSAKREAAKAHAVTEFLADTISSVDPAEKGRDVKLADLLDDAGKQVTQNYADKPDVSAALHAALARSYHSLGLETEALAHVNAALDGFLKHPIPDRPDTRIARLTEAGISRHLFQVRRGPAPIANLLLELREKTLGRDEDDTRRVLEGLAWTYGDQGKLPEAIATFRDLAERAERHGGPDALATLTARRLLGEAILESGDVAPAEEILLDVLERTP